MQRAQAPLSSLHSKVEPRLAGREAEAGRGRGGRSRPGLSVIEVCGRRGVAGRASGSKSGFSATRRSPGVGLAATGAGGDSLRRVQPLEVGKLAAWRCARRPVTSGCGAVMAAWVEVPAVVGVPGAWPTRSRRTDRSARWQPAARGDGRPLRGRSRGSGRLKAEVRLRIEAPLARRDRGRRSNDARGAGSAAPERASIPLLCRHVHQCASVPNIDKCSIPVSAGSNSDWLCNPIPSLAAEAVIILANSAETPGFVAAEGLYLAAKCCEIWVAVRAWL